MQKTKKKKKNFRKRKNIYDSHLVFCTRILVWSLVGIFFIVSASVMSGAERKKDASLARLMVSEVAGSVYTKPEPKPILVKLFSPQSFLHKINLEKKNFEVILPILIYHYIGPIESGFDEIRQGLTVTPETFRSQMQWLKDNGYITRTLSGYFESLVKGEDMGDKNVIITFDDGYKNVYDNALPILEKYGQTAVLFIIAEGKDPIYMNKDEIKDAHDRGFEIGSHTISHPSLVNISNESARNEIGESKKILEDIIGHPVNFFCYPYGYYNWGTIDIVRGAGYRGALTTESGMIISNQNIYRMPRKRITNTMVGQGFASVVGSVLE